MCYRVSCKQCGKFTWGGCGKHLTTLYSSIDEGQHCMCRPWPGIVVPSQSQSESEPEPPQPKLQASDSTATLEKLAPFPDTDETSNR